jgi:uncharacterized tellurite resistance protein B-like protein
MARAMLLGLQNAATAPTSHCAVSEAIRRRMLESFRALFADLTGGSKHQGSFEENDYRLAAAALLVHVTAIDGEVSTSERGKLHALLKYRFSLDDEATEALISAAMQAEGEAVDMYRFTNLINRSLDEEGRLRIVEMMWEMIYADGQVNEFEENVVWRAADLLGVSARQRIALRQDVAQSFGQPGEPEPTAS